MSDRLEICRNGNSSYDRICFQWTTNLVKSLEITLTTFKDTLIKLNIVEIKRLVKLLLHPRKQKTPGDVDTTSWKIHVEATTNTHNIDKGFYMLIRHSASQNAGIHLTHEERDKLLCWIFENGDNTFPV